MAQPATFISILDFAIALNNLMKFQLQDKECCSPDKRFHHKWLGIVNRTKTRKEDVNSNQSKENPSFCVITFIIILFFVLDIKDESN